MPEGTWVIHFHYHAPYIEVSVAASAASIVLLIGVGAVVPLASRADVGTVRSSREVTGHRRRRGSHGPGARRRAERARLRSSSRSLTCTSRATSSALGTCRRSTRSTTSAVDVVIDFSSPEGVAYFGRLVRGPRRRARRGHDRTHEGPAQALARGGTARRGRRRDELLHRRRARPSVSPRWRRPYFERVEIIELHHDKKVDAPSGTSITTRDGHRRRAPRRRSGAAAATRRRATPSTVRAGPTSLTASRSTRFACPDWSPTKRCSSARRARGSPFATTPLTARASCTASRSPSSTSTRRPQFVEGISSFIP